MEGLSDIKSRNNKSDKMFGCELKDCAGQMVVSSFLPRRLSTICERSKTWYIYQRVNESFGHGLSHELPHIVELHQHGHVTLALLHRTPVSVRVEF